MAADTGPGAAGAVTGVSQGGGIAPAVSGLVDGLAGDLRVYGSSGHEDGTAYHRAEQPAWVHALFAGLPAGRSAPS